MSPATLVPGEKLKSQKSLKQWWCMMVVPVEGIEPPFLSERDFESRASTSSATRAYALYIVGGCHSQKEIEALGPCVCREDGPMAPVARRSEGVCE